MFDALAASYSQIYPIFPVYLRLWEYGYVDIWHFGNMGRYIFPHIPRYSHIPWECCPSLRNFLESICDTLFSQSGSTVEVGLVKRIYLEALDALRNFFQVQEVLTVIPR